MKCPVCGTEMRQVCDPVTKECTWICPKCDRKKAIPYKNQNK